MDAVGLEPSCPLKALAAVAPIIAIATQRALGERRRAQCDTVRPHTAGPVPAVVEARLGPAR